MISREAQLQKKFPFSPDRMSGIRSSEVMLGTVMQHVITTLRTSDRDLADITRSIATNRVKIEVQVKGKGDFASTADKLLGGQLMKDLRPVVKGAEFLVEDPPTNEKKNCIEENRDTITSTQYVWVIDPLCGSKNFIEAMQLARKLNNPDFNFDTVKRDMQDQISTLLGRVATSVALMQYGKVVLGGILYKGDIFFAHDGREGAWCLKAGEKDPIPFVLNDETVLRESTFATGSKPDNWDPTKSPVPEHWFPAMKANAKNVVTDTCSPIADGLLLGLDLNHGGQHGVFYPTVELAHKAALWKIIPRAGWRIKTENGYKYFHGEGVITNGQGGDDIFLPGFCASVGFSTQKVGLELARVPQESLRQFMILHEQGENGRLQEQAVQLRMFEEAV